MNPIFGESNYTLMLRAEVFATAAHAAVGQVRKYTGKPYITHPHAVANLVAEAGGSFVMIAAAWLHDVVEDTAVTIETIEAEFGPDVASLVRGLTDVSKPEDGNRAQRKAIDRAFMAKQSPECKTIKLADMINNTVSIVSHDPEFAKTYMAEKALLLEVLTEGDAGLFEQAKKLQDIYQHCVSADHERL